MNYREFVIAAACVWGMMSTANAAEPRAVVELFTSQGCSSCPPADRLMGQLVQDSSLIVLSLPVDYWDYLGWKDTLALHSHSERQRDYASARGDREVYTPQAVINGMMHANGSDKPAIDSAITQTRRQAQPLSLPVTLAVKDDTVIVHLSEASPGTANASGIAKVWLFPVTAKTDVKIGRGENHGRTLTYYNVVRRWIPLGTWNGKAEDYAVPLKEIVNAKFSLRDVDRLAVLVQRQGGPGEKPGLILGAAMASLR